MRWKTLQAPGPSPHCSTWADINKEMSQFSNFYAGTERKKHSGKTERTTRYMFKLKNGVPFSCTWKKPSLITLNVHRSMMLCICMSALLAASSNSYTAGTFYETRWTIDFHPCLEFYLFMFRTYVLDGCWSSRLVKFVDLSYCCWFVCDVGPGWGEIS
jgi:hypothetical protein